MQPWYVHRLVDVYLRWEDDVDLNSPSWRGDIVVVLVKTETGAWYGATASICVPGGKALRVPSEAYTPAGVKRYANYLATAQAIAAEPPYGTAVQRILPVPAEQLHTGVTGFPWSGPAAQALWAAGGAKNAAARGRLIKATVREMGKIVLPDFDHVLDVIIGPTKECMWPASRRTWIAKSCRFTVAACLSGARMMPTSVVTSILTIAEVVQVPTVGHCPRKWGHTMNTVIANARKTGTLLMLPDYVQFNQEGLLGRKQQRWAERSYAIETPLAAMLSAFCQEFVESLHEMARGGHPLLPDDGYATRVITAAWETTKLDETKKIQVGTKLAHEIGFYRTITHGLSDKKTIRARERHLDSVLKWAPASFESVKCLRAGPTSDPPCPLQMEKKAVTCGEAAEHGCAKDVWVQNYQKRKAMGEGHSQAARLSCPPCLGLVEYTGRGKHQHRLKGGGVIGAFEKTVLD